MERLYLEITPLGNVPMDVFVKIVGVPAKRCNLRGRLRVLGDHSLVLVTVEGPEEEVRDYYIYMSLCDDVVGTVTKVKEDTITKYTETDPFHVENSSEEDGEDESDERASWIGVNDEEEDRREQVVEQADRRVHEVRVIPETPEKEGSSSSESEAEVQPSPAKEESQTMYLDEPKSPVFKPHDRLARRREPVGNPSTSNLFEDEEDESQSILQRKRKRKQVN